MAHQHPSIGTTARADPVSNANLLFPNGFDRNENRPNRPLVKVLDIADIDDKFCEDDYAFENDDNPAENVTVTIKLCPEGIVTSTEERQKDSKSDQQKPKVKSPFEQVHEAGKHCDDVVLEGATGVTLDTGATGSSLDNIHTDHDNIQQVHAPATSYIVENRQQISPIKDTLFEEYERFVSRSPPVVSEAQGFNSINDSPSHTTSSKQNSVGTEVIDLTKDDHTRPKKHEQGSQSVTKPKITVVKPVILKSFQSETKPHGTTENSPRTIEHTQLVERSYIFSPKTRTPIVIEVSQSDNDEGQDFMAYLQELQQTPKTQTTSNSKNSHQRTPKRQRKIHISDRKNERRNSDFIHTEQSPTPKSYRSASIDVIVISDEDDNDTSNSLIDFQFNSLKKKNGEGGNAVNDVYDNNPNVCEGIEHSSKTYTDRTGEEESKSETTDDENEPEEEDNDEDLDGISGQRKDDDDDGDKDHNNEKGNGNNSSHGNDDDFSDDHRDDFDNNSNFSDDADEHDNQCQNEGHFSPGVRSRNSIGVETVSDFDSVEEGESDDDVIISTLSINIEHRGEITSPEDEEVSEFLDIPNRQDSLDCRFETIESRGMDVDSYSDTTENSDSGCKRHENEMKDDTCSSSYYNVGFRKVTPKLRDRPKSSPPSIDQHNSQNLIVNNDLHTTVDYTANDEWLASTPGTLGNKTLTQVVSDDSSSYLETDTESAFESAVEDEFWANTVFSESSANEFSSPCSETDQSDCDDKAGTDNVEDADKLFISLRENIDISDDEYESATDNEQDMMETKYCNDVSEKAANNYSLVVPQNTLKFEDSNFVDHGRVCTDKHIRKIRETARTISYIVPFFHQVKKQEVNLKLRKKFRLICKLRQKVLEKVLPRKDSVKSEIIDTDDTDVDYVEKQIDWDKISRCLAEPEDTSNEETLRHRNGQIKVLGQGFYIFGAWEDLHLPAGPKLKKLVVDFDKEIARRSCYFRGIPGIINNAHKMSNYIFPKLALPRDSASRRILHACNRLATQLSPISSRPPDISHGMMHEEKSFDESDESDSTLSQGLHELLMSAKDLLNSSRFEDAEVTFLKLYKEIQEKPEDSSCLLVETLSGFADICIRRSRMCRSNPLEWQWLCMHAIALLQYTVEFCESELENHLDNQEIEWFTEQRQSAENKCRPLEDAFLRALYNCLKHDAGAFDPFQSFSLPNTPVSQNRITRLFPLSSTMPQYLVVPGMRYRITDKGLTKQSQDDSELAVDWLAKFQHYCKDRLQSKDHKGVTEKVLKAGKDGKNEDDTESVLSNGSHDSLDWDHSDLQGIDEISAEPDEESPVSDYSFEYELVSVDSENEGWDFFLHQRRNCSFESVVQVASNFEKCDDNYKDSQKLSKETSDLYQHEKSEKNEKVKRKHTESRDIVSPLHEHSISLTLARSFCRLADKLVQEEEYKKAEAVYEKILDIIDTIQDGTAGMLRFSARIMKNLGTVKSKQGKSSSGLVLLNKALNTYRDLQDEEANFEIAVALIELGNGYIVGKDHEDSVFDDVIIAICDFFEKDASDSHSASTSSSGSASQISQMTSSLGSNSEERNVEEAVVCYSEAIALLDHFEADEKQIDMFAKAVMRLGDCYFMQKDYDKALECYERALGMFKTNNIFGKDSLMENAHVLCMLGVSSFMLHVYPRAASVFEMALHMVRCAYGFKRTFLNGMLQSLSGITYYKMKNYHKCVSMCYQGYETYCEIFGESMSRLDKQKFWLVCQTLYVMGNSYNILNLQQKAMKYLKIARSLMKSSKCRERRQFMRVLQILGDAYFAQYDYKTALQFYNEALEYGECESQVSFDEVFDPNCASDEMTIHNHLVSKSAEAHLSMQQYQNAVHYLEQAHDMQEVMGEDIKEDLINTLNQLGHMHSMAGDVNKAIESYKECLEVFSEIHQGKLGPEMCTTLGNLGAMCYVKACISGTQEEEQQMTHAADNYFQDAIDLDRNAEVCVKYGNFLYSQCNFNHAITYLIDAILADHMASDIVYGGLEKVTLPELLQDEVDTQEEICLPSSCLARYLLILCHKASQEMDLAEGHLIYLMEEVSDYGIPLLHSLLGYAMMELMLFEEAAECFLTAAESEEDYQLAYENYCICLLVIVLRALKSGMENVLDYYTKLYRKNFSGQHGLYALRFTI